MKGLSMNYIKMNSVLHKTLVQGDLQSSRLTRLFFIVAMALFVALGVVLMPATAPAQAYADNVATIDGTNYDSLQAAIDAATDGQTITLKQDTTANIKIEDKKLTIDLGNHTVDGGQAGSVFTITSTGKLSRGQWTKERSNVTIKNGTIKNGKANSGGGVYAEKSLLTLENLTICDNESTESSANAGGGGVFSGESTELTVRECTFTNDNASGGSGCGGALFLKAKFDISDITINGCSAGKSSGKGHAIQIGQSTSGQYSAYGTISGGTISDCPRQNINGTLHITRSYEGVTIEGVTFSNLDVPLKTEEPDGDLTFKNCTFENCRSYDDYNYGIKLTNSKDSKTFTFEDCVFKGNPNEQQPNSFLWYGGSGTLNIIGGSITGYKTKAGAFILGGDGDKTISGTVITNNVATKSGTSSSPVVAGGIQFTGGTLTIKDGAAIYGNTGALYSKIGKTEKSRPVDVDIYAATPSKLTLLDANTMIDPSMGDDYFSKLEYKWQDVKTSGDKTSTTNYYAAVPGVDVSEFLPFKVNDEYCANLSKAVNKAQSGDKIEANPGTPTGTTIFNSEDTVSINKQVTLDLNGCSISSRADALFDVADGGNVTIVDNGESDGQILKTVKTSGSGNLTVDSAKVASIQHAGGSLTAQGTIENFNVILDEGKVIKAADGLNAHFTIGVNDDFLKLFKDVHASIPDTTIIENFKDTKAVSLVGLANALLVTNDKDVLISKAPAEDVVYLSESGDDKNNGTSAKDAVATFERAKNIAKGTGLNKIAIVDTLTIEGEPVEWDGDGIPGLQIIRDHSLLNEMVNVTGNLKLSNVTFDGQKDDGLGHSFGESEDYRVHADAAMIKVASGGQLTITDGVTLQNNENKNVSLQNRTDHNILKHEILGGAINNKGTVVMTGGTITKCSSPMGGAIFNEGTLWMSGGSITGNSATPYAPATSKYPDDLYRDGGGVMNSTKNAVMYFVGGEISGNYAKNGGGIAVGTGYFSNFSSAKLYMQPVTELVTDGVVSQNEIPAGIETGTPLINGNSAAQNGGGIYVASGTANEGGGSQAYITIGTISENKASGETYSGGVKYTYPGGGIYVNGQLGTKSGELYLENVEIANNTSEYSGSAIATCPSSNVKVYLRNGGVIHDNTCGSDATVSIESGYYINTSHSGYPNIALSAYMLGGGAYNWEGEFSGSSGRGFIERHTLEVNEYGDVKTPNDWYGAHRFYTDVSETGEAANDVKNGVALATVHIVNNEAANNSGGGIGANGNIQIGEADPVIRLEKLVDGPDAALHADDEFEFEISFDAGLLPDDPGPLTVVKNGVVQPEQLTFSNVNGKYVSDQKLKLKPGDVVLLYGDHLKAGRQYTITETNTNGATKTSATYTTDYDKQQWNEKIAEQGAAEPTEHDAIDWNVEQVESSTVEGKVLGGEGYAVPTSVTFTNTFEGGALTLTKHVVSPEGDEAFKAPGEYTFTITGPDAARGNTYKATKVDSDPVEQKDVTFSAGLPATAEFKIQGEESWTISGLPEGEYAVTETLNGAEVDGYKLTVTSDGNELGADGVKATVKSGESVDVAITNTYTLGSLTLHKTVVGAPQDAPDLVYTFTVTGPDGYKQTVTITGEGDATLNNLKPGEYTVTETRDGANIEGYTLKVTGEGSVTLEAGGSGEITVTNTYTKLGDLAVSKDVVGAQGEKDKLFHFTVTLSDTTINGTYGGMTFENGVAEFDLTDGATVTASGIPAGVTYTVTEADYSDDGYTTSSTGSSGEILPGATSLSRFTNARSGGSLIVTKYHEGDDRINPDKEFHFTVTLSDTTINGTYGPVTFVNGVGEFTLKGSQTVIISGLPDGVTYTVTESEANQDNYETTVQGATGTIEDDRTASAVFTNERYTASLELAKTVTNGDAEDRATEFHFGVDIVPPQEGTFGDFTFDENGHADVTLKHGDVLRAPGLQAGTHYTVTEAEANEGGFTTHPTNADATLAQHQTGRALFNNVKDDEELGSLTLTKVVWGGGEENYTTRPYTFTVTGPDGYRETVTVNGVGRTVLDGLQPGEYTVTEGDASLEGYEWTVEVLGSTTVEANADSPVYVVNVYTPETPGEPTLPSITYTPPENLNDNATPLSNTTVRRTTTTAQTQPSSPQVEEVIDDLAVPLGSTPKTGDERNLGLWETMGIISMAGVVICGAGFAISTKRRKKNTP